MISIKRIKQANMSFKEDTRGMEGAIMALVMMAIGLLILAVVFTVGPVVGYNVENSVTIPTTSMWNSGTNLAITNGSELWAQNTPMVSVAALVVIVGVLIFVLMSVMGGRGGKLGGAGGV